MVPVNWNVKPTLFDDIKIGIGMYVHPCYLAAMEDEGFLC